MKMSLFKIYIAEMCGGCFYVKCVPGHDFEIVSSKRRNPGWASLKASVIFN